MNPSNFFGSQQGAFQAPNNGNRSGNIFQSFTQQNTMNSQQNVGFGQTSTFGQPSAFSQPSVFGQTSGQTSVFGQTFGQNPSFGQGGGLTQSTTQTPAFGQPALGQPTTGFGAPPPFAQSSGQNQGLMFTQTSAIGQSPAFGAFGQQTPGAFGQQTPGFGIQGTTSSSGASGTQPMSFGTKSTLSQPSAFPQPTVTSTPSLNVPNVAQKSGFGVSEFGFKPSNEAVFKPIFSSSPEPANTQPSSEPFGTSMSAPTSMDSSGPPSTGFSLSSAQTGALGFSFARPITAASITGQAAGGPQRDTPPTSSSSASNVKFFFSQPAAPSSSSSTTSVAQPTAVPSSPSSFSFTSKVLQPQGEPEKFSFGVARQSAFGDPKVKSEATTSTEASHGTDEASGESAFKSFGKGTKRKEEPDDPTAAQGKTAKVEADAQGAAAASRQPSKRPLLRNRGLGGGLFGKAMHGVLSSSVNPVKREAKEDDQVPDWGQTQRTDAPAPSVRVSAPPPRSQAPTREVLEKAEEMASLEAAEPEPKTPRPGKRQQRQESSDSLGGLSPTDLTAIQCKGVPPNLNRKDVIEKHFNRFGKVRRVFCRPQKNLAIVHFQDHASAAKAKKKGKMLHGNELVIFYQRKKQSPAEKGVGSAEGESSVSETEEVRPKGFQSSPLRRPLPRSSAVSSTVTIGKGSPLKKTAIAKALQFESESQQDSAAEGQSSERAVSSLPSSLLHLVGQLAETAEEKYRLLEQRDKILRQGRPKRTDLDMSKVFVGTCPDMCPEKERYMRETRNQLSSYEVLPETEKVDHCAAIKEYSRSSADQEEPLPHELRPLPVLKMTMDYLVTQVMDQGEGNYADWYDFVWNRTRGIRKDITQQHLCDPDTVSLIEKCTRFHIHCAHHLCQEPMMAFDAKINNENMTKCLQSLKEMYQDLATRGIHCPNEAEFRQYNVLLKMNDGDILREVQQFREEVRNSPEVKFAVQAFAAHNSNNFVRFFKLVKSASYLSSCILHRYFNQVRGEALRALNVAYTIGSHRSTAFPIDNLVRMLMFRNTEEASSFIQHYGLAINESLVELSRTAYQEPELSLPQRKSLAIEKKRTVLIGQVVHGGPLPNPPQHTPVCSFDSQNKYRGEKLAAEPAPSAGPAGVMAFKQEQKPGVESEPRPLLKPRMLVEPRLLAEPQAAVGSTQPGDGDETGQRAEPAALPGPGQELQNLFQPIEQPQPDRPPSPPPKPEVVYSDQDIMAEVESVVEEVLVAEVSGVAKAGAEYASTALSVSDVQLEAVVSEVVQEMLRDISMAEMSTEKQRIAEEKRRLEEARRKQEHEAFLDLFSGELCLEISEEVVRECIKETAASEMQLALEEKAACVARSSQAVCENLVEETLEMELAELAQEILDVELQRIHKFIKKWRDVVAVRRQLKRQMRGFPAAPCCVDPRFKLTALAPSAPHSPSLDSLARGLVNLGNAGNMAVSCTRLLKFRKEALHQMRVHYFYNQLLSECVWTPLDLPTLVAESIPNPPERIFWKAMLLLPSSHESDASITNSILTDWLEAKFSGGEERVESSDLPAGAVQTLTISNGLRELDQRTHKVHVCIKVTRGPLGEETQTQMEESKELLGTNALLMLLPPSLGGEGEGESEEDVSLLSALLQLKQVQQSSSWHTPMPLAVVVPGHLDEAVSDQKLEEDLMLKTLVDDGLISNYMFVRIPETTNDMQGTEQVRQAVKWLVAHSPAASPLTSQTLVDFVEAGLCREFSSRLYRDKQERMRAGLPCQDPAPIIQLYNSVLLFLAGLVSSEQLCSLSWPPAEFSLPETRDLLPHLDWNSPPHLAWLKRAILSLQLPEWDLPPVTASWPCLCASIIQYVSQIPSSRHSQPLLMSRVENLLVRVRAQNPGAQEEDEEEEEEEEDLKAGPSFQHVPWDEIVALCIDHRLKDWRPPECPVSEDAITDDGQILVYFQKEGLSHFLPPASWAEAVTHTRQEKRQQELQQSKTTPRPSLTPPVRALRQRLFQSALEVQEAPSPSELDITHTPTPHQLLPQRLLSGIQQEKAHSQRFEEQLRRWLDGDSLDTPTLPLLVPSTLLTLPELMTHTRKPAAPAAATGAMAASFTQAADMDDAEKSSGDWLRGPPVSIAQRIQDLDRTIAASREEELAFGLTLSSLLNIVED